MKKQFNFYYLLTILDVILAINRFMSGDILMGISMLCVGIALFRVGRLEVLEAQEGDCEDEERHIS